MGKSGGSGGGTPKIEIPQALGSGPGSMFYNTFNPLGTYASQTLPSLMGLYNWASNLATGGNVAQADWAPTPTGTLDLGSGARTYAPFTGGGTTGGSGINPFNGGSAGTGTGQSSLLGPFLSGAEGGIGAETNLAQQFANLTNGGANIFNQGQGIFNQGQGAFNTGTQMLNQARNKGLFPAQQAEINQAVASQQAALQQQLGSEGLGQSTVAKQLAGQVKLSGAAAAGQLIQGNIQLAEGEQGVGLEGEQLGFQGEQLGTQVNQALYNEFAGIASQNAALQQQTWNEAMQGMGAFGTMLNATLQPFGYSMKTQEDVLQANVSEADLQAKMSADQAQAAQQGFSSMMGGLGALFGQGGSGGSGGILGGLGGLLGGGSGGLGAAAGGWGANIAEGVGGTALAGSGGLGGAIGGLGGSIGGLISALGAVFACQVAMAVYGISDPSWIKFREYLLFRSPKWFRRLYVSNAFWFSGYIKTRPRLRGFIRLLMDVAIWYDSATRKI